MHISLNSLRGKNVAVIKKAFTEHPASVGESYFEHMGMAFSFSSKMFAASICCFFHGLFPFLFVKTGSNCIDHLHNRMVVNRDRRECTDAGGEMQALTRDKAEMSAAE